jgi:adenylate/guanylate cyclase family protein
LSLSAGERRLRGMPRRTGAPERLLATVMFTDIVGSTDLAAKLGDRGWRHLLSQHHAFVRKVLKRYGGREIDTAGDSFFATFNQPARAINCAKDLVEGLHRMGIEIRAGIHMGEVEVIGPKVGGIAVHIGSRVMSKAGPGEVLVSSTVRDLMSGSEIRFDFFGPLDHVGPGCNEETPIQAGQSVGHPESSGGSGGISRNRTEVGLRQAEGKVSCRSGQSDDQGPRVGRLEPGDRGGLSIDVVTCASDDVGKVEKSAAVTAEDRPPWLRNEWGERAEEPLDRSHEIACHDRGARERWRVTQAGLQTEGPGHPVTGHSRRGGREVWLREGATLRRGLPTEREEGPDKTASE